MYNILLLAIAGIFCLLHQSVLAQTDFQEGYIVTHARDTVTGWLDNRSETRNVRQCDFKKSPVEQPVRYQPRDILGYGFRGGKLYESRKLSYGSPAPITEQVFLELLVKGKASLYHFKDDGRYYVEKGNQGLIGLYKTDKFINHEGRTRVIEQKQYIGILALLMIDCPSLDKKIKGTALEFNQLVDLVTAYNNCKAGAPSLKTNRPFLTARAGLVWGLQRANAHFSTQESGYEHLEGSVFPASTAPFGGLYLQTTLPWVTERFSLWWEIHYAKAVYSADFTKNIGHEWNSTTKRTVREETRLAFNCLRLPLLARYTFPRGKVKPFVQAGAMADYLLRSHSYSLRETEQAASTWDKEQQAYVYTSSGPAIEMRKTNFYAVLAAGIEHCLTPQLRWYAELRGATGNTMVQPGPSPQHKANTRIIVLQAGLGF